MNNNCPTNNKCKTNVNNFLTQVCLFKRQLFNPLHLLLLIFAVVSALVGAYWPTLTILVSILFVCTISFVKELRLLKRQQLEAEQKVKEQCDATRKRDVISSTGLAGALDKVASISDCTQNSESLAVDVEPEPCLLLAHVDQLSEYLVVIHCSLIALATILGIIQQVPPSESAYYALSLAILAIPEGLPALAAGVSSARGGGAAADYSDSSDQCAYLTIHNFLIYQLSISFASITLIAISFASRTEPALGMCHLLYVNLLADGPLGQSLGCEQPSEEELSLWPRTVRDPLVNWRLIGATLSLTTTLIALNAGLYNYLLDSTGHLDEHAKTLLFSCFVFCTAFAALSLRSKFKTVFESRIYANLQLLFSCTSVVIIQTCVTQIGALSRLLQIEPISPLELLLCFLYASLVLLVMDSLKVAARYIYRARHLFIKLAQRLQVPSAPFADSFYSTSSLAKAGNSSDSKINTNHDHSIGSSGIGSSRHSDASSGGKASRARTKFDSLLASQLPSGSSSSSPRCTAIKPVPSLIHNGSAHF